MSYEKELEKHRKTGLALGLLNKYASLDKEAFDKSEEKVDALIKEAFGRGAFNRILGKPYPVGNPGIIDDLLGGHARKVKRRDNAVPLNKDDAVDGEFAETGNPLSTHVVRPRSERFGGGLVGGGGNRGGGGGGNDLGAPWYGEGGNWYNLNRPGGGMSNFGKGLLGLTALGGTGAGAYASGNAGGQVEGAEKAVDKFTKEYSNMSFLEKLMFFFKTMFSDQNEFRDQLTQQVNPRGLAGKGSA